MNTSHVKGVFLQFLVAWMDNYKVSVEFAVLRSEIYVKV